MRTSRARSTSPSFPGSSNSRRSAILTATPSNGSSPPPISGLVPLGLDPALPPDTVWHEVDRLPDRIAFDHQNIVLAGRERLRAKLSYTNIGFALAPERFSVSELSGIYSAALGYPVDPTNLRRVLERRGLLEATGERRTPGREGGRPAAVYRFASLDLEVTDPFAVLRPPVGPATAE